MTGDQKIAAVLRLEAADVRVPSDLRERIKSAAVKPRQRYRRLANTVAGLVASLLLLAALPAPRVAATNAIRQVFHLAGVKFVVNSGTQSAPAIPTPGELVPEPDSDHRWFYTASGPLPQEGVAGVKQLGPQFRMPTWLPEALPKRLQLPPEGYAGEPIYYGLAIGNEITMGARSPGWGLLQFQGGATKLDARPVVLGGAEGLEVNTGNQISFYVAVDNVAYTFSGPIAQQALLRKIAESLVPKGY